METKVFKVGDRVAAYEKGVKQIGMITTIQGESFWIDTGLESTSGVYHFKQCRRLKPKKRREFWVTVCKENGQPFHAFLNPYKADSDGPNFEVIHVKEINAQKG